MDHKLAW